MMKPIAAYSRAQLLAARAALPRRVLLCRVCGLRVPQFAVLERRDRQRIIRLLNDGSPLMALTELRNANARPERWARPWILHGGRPGALRPGLRCPRCRRFLESSRALRCVVCGTDGSGDPSPRS